ncbi:MAG: cupredoxin domain-containing protein [Rhodanobacteraceae bacterium]
MFIRYAASMAACLLLAACAMTPPQPVAKPPPLAAILAPPAPATTVSKPVTPAPVVTVTMQAFKPAPASSMPSAPEPPGVTRTPKPVPVGHRPHVAEKMRGATRKAEHARRASATPPHIALVELTGHVDLTGSHGQRVSPADYAQTIVYFVPAARNVLPVPGNYTVFTHNRHFDPRAMAVSLGSTIKFTNLDDFRHNVYSVTPGSVFDIGYQAGGSSVSHTFTHAGLVLISCHVHHAMALNLLVVPTRYVARLGADGRFVFQDLPEGLGTLHIWNPRAKPVRMSVDLPVGKPVAQMLSVSMPAVPTQLYVGGSP